MQGLNKVTLIGWLAAKPELKRSKNGIAYTRLRLATRRLKATKEEGFEQAHEREDKYHTDWHSIFVWGNTAENCARYLSKGALLAIEGSLTYWEIANEEHTSYKNAIHAEQVQFLSYGSTTANKENTMETENLDNFEPPRNHNAVAHPA